MSVGRVSRGQAVLTAALLLALTPRAALAETPAATKAAAAAPLSLWLDTGGAVFDQQQLRESLARELGREVVITSQASAAVQIKLESAARARVRYTTPGGDLLTRTVELPPDRARSVQVLSWLTVNLVRDEASELLDQLRARRKDEADARAVEEKAAADKAAADKAAADKAAADKAAADKAAADKAAADLQARQKAEERARLDAGPTQDGLLRDPKKSFDAAVATPLSLLPDSAKRELHLQLALGYGESGGLRGIAVSPSVLRIRRDLRGIALGAGAVFVGQNTRGIVVAAGYSQLEGTLDGIQVGVGAAVQRGKFVRGAVVSGGGAIAGEVEGAVVGGGIALARSLDGVAVAVGATVVRGRSIGVLVGGGVNFSADHRGVEVSAGVNVARDLQGIALSPINLHRHVKGLQVGIVNVAEEVDGAAIGVVSLSKNGRFQPVVWGSLDGAGHLALKSIVGYAYTQLGAGLDIPEPALSYEGGLGAHFKLSPSWFLEPGVHYSWTQSTDGAADAHRIHYLGQLGFRAGGKIDLLVAAGVRHTVSGGGGVAPEIRAGIAFF